MKNLILFLIKIYKKYFSLYLKTLFGGGCRFTPTCSEYAYSAVEKYGTMKGLFLSIKRISKCNPLFLTKFDPLE